MMKNMKRIDPMRETNNDEGPVLIPPLSIGGCAANYLGSFYYASIRI